MSDAVAPSSREPRRGSGGTGAPIVMTARDSGNWVPTGSGAPAPAARLFCFPHAGGSYTAFSGWRERVPATIEIVSFCYPGRLRLIREKPLVDLGDLLAEVSTSIASLLDAPFVLLGHSLGTLVAFELARHQRRTQGPGPAGLIVSGHVAPQLPRPTPDLHRLPADELIASLNAMEGLPAGLGQSTELLSLVLPSVRADLQMNETYTCDEEPPLDVPMLALAGESDPQASPDGVHAWHRHTRASFTFETFPGGHFFPMSDRDRMLASIRLRLREWFGAAVCAG